MNKTSIYSAEEAALLPAITTATVRKQLDEFCRRILAIKKWDEIDPISTDIVVWLDSIGDRLSEEEVRNINEIIEIVMMRAMESLVLSAPKQDRKGHAGGLHIVPNAEPPEYKGKELELLREITDETLRAHLDDICQRSINADSLLELLQIQEEAMSSILPSIENDSNRNQIDSAVEIIRSVALRIADIVGMREINPESDGPESA